MTAAAGRGGHRAMLAVIMFVVIVFCIAQTLLIPAIPAIQAEYDASASAATWVLTSFMLTSVVATPLLGRVGDIYGKQRVMVWLLWVFALGCVICALGSSIGVLVLGRAIQGVAAATFPLAYGIVRDEFPRERVAGAIGLVSAMLGVGTGTGLVLSGPVLDLFGVHGIFWSMVGLCVASAVLTQLYVPASRFRARASLDVVGGLLLSAALLALLLAISQANAWGWDSGRILGLLLAAAVISVVWTAWELRTEDPLVDISLMRERAVWTTNVAAITLGFVLTVSMFLVPRLIQTPEAAGYGFGATVTASGLYMLPRSGVTFLAGPLSGRLGSRFGFHLPLAIGIAFAGLAYVWLALVHDSSLAMYLQNATIGIATGLGFAAMTNLVVATVPRDVTGVALGVNTVMRAIGAAIASQIAITLVTAQAGPLPGFPGEAGYTTAFLVTAAVAVVGLGVVALIPRTSHHVPEAETLLEPDPVTVPAAAPAAR